MVTSVIVCQLKKCTLSRQIMQRTVQVGLSVNSSYLGYNVSAHVDIFMVALCNRADHYIYGRPME